jgi:hypothetical protein
MPNFLESLLDEWFEFSGYFVRRNILVGRRQNGGHECELDVVAFHPVKRRLVQVEPSMDTDSWARREERYQKKFDAGRRYIPAMFAGLDLPTEIDQIALLVYGSAANHTTLGGGRIVPMKDLMTEIRASLAGRPIESAAVSENFPMLRALQYAAYYWGVGKPSTVTGKPVA